MSSYSISDSYVRDSFICHHWEKTYHNSIRINYILNKLNYLESVSHLYYI